jgi:hypothetical protein
VTTGTSGTSGTTGDTSVTTELSTTTGWNITGSLTGLTGILNNTAFQEREGELTGPTQAAVSNTLSGTTIIGASTVASGFSFLWIMYLV